MVFGVLSSAGCVWKLGDDYWSLQEILSNLDVRTPLRRWSSALSHDPAVHQPQPVVSWSVLLLEKEKDLGCGWAFMQHFLFLG